MISEKKKEIVALSDDLRTMIKLPKIKPSDMACSMAIIREESKSRIAFFKEVNNITDELNNGKKPSFETLEKCRDDYRNLLSRVRENRGIDVSDHVTVNANKDIRQASKHMDEIIVSLKNKQINSGKPTLPHDSKKKQISTSEKSVVAPGAASFTGDLSEDEIATESRNQRKRVKDAKERMKILNTQLKSINTAITVQQKNLEQYRKKQKKNPRYAQTLEQMTDKLNSLIDHQRKYTDELQGLKMIIADKGMTREDIARQETTNNQKQFEKALRDNSKAYSEDMSKMQSEHSEEMQKLHEEYETSKKESAELLAKTNEVLLAMQAAIEEQKARNEELIAQNAELSKPALQKLKEKTQKQLSNAAENIKKAFKKQEKLQVALASYCNDESEYQIGVEGTDSPSYSQSVKNTIDGIKEDIKRLNRALHAATNEDEKVDIRAEITACEKMLKKYENEDK